MQIHMFSNLHHSLFDHLLLIFKSSGNSYQKIFFFMFIDSLSLPIFLPSEFIVMSAYYSSKHGALNIHLVAFFASLGAILGSYLNYSVAKKLGYDFFLKYGKFILLNKKKIDFVFNNFLKHSLFVMFIARLLPFIKHIVTIPAGIMNIKLRYVIFCTYAGSTLFVYYVSYVFSLIMDKSQNMIEMKQHIAKYLLFMSGALLFTYLILCFIVVLCNKMNFNKKIIKNIKK